ncbi:unnamed protein product [Cuscuta campestris]|uniref:CRM domain-containing protein n=1 Tax=Cuscuta campestris TaxID=132261 RepID=A0A484MVX2_9ASTE|nr:unnamed protein product [Cuscuta campestris]
MLVLPPGNYLQAHQSRTLLKPPPLIFLSFPWPTSQNPKVAGRVQIRRLSPSSAAASSADAQSVSQSAIERIAEKLRSLGYVEEDGNKEKPEGILRPRVNSASPGQIFIPLPTQLPKYRVGHTLDPSWSTPQNPVPLPGSGNAIQRFHDLRNEVKKAHLEEREKGKDEKKERVPTSAELTLPAKELSRLRTLGIRLKQKINIGKPGITEGIVNSIHERWRRSELVKIKCEDLCKMNMKRTHDILEAKTGGLVIWRSGSTIVLYRGTDYEYPYFVNDNASNGDALTDVSADKLIDHGAGNGVSSPTLIKGVGSPNIVRFELPGEAELVEEADQMLEGLGPRYTDWWGYHPLPVDADLLPDIVPGYKRPFRLLPYGVKPILTNDEMTTLKRLARPVRCHFALGKNRNLQGLASAIVKLWEKCEIAKVAVKRGVQNMNSKLMAEELKHLTGGILLARDKDYITLYRGKDFLPAAVSSAIEERRMQTTREKHTQNGNSSVVDAKEQTQTIIESASFDHNACVNIKRAVQEKKFLSLREEAAQSSTEFSCNVQNTEKLNKKVVVQKRLISSVEAAIKRTVDKLEAALEKKAKTEKLIEELDMEEISVPSDADKEGITKEERCMLRRVGLRMKPFLLLGRRGIFSGTIENMHLHWKYRELVKIIAAGKGIEEVWEIARLLERESCGILVAIEQTSKGYAIIVYRGKNYIPPASLRPLTLLSKGQAMKRSIEAQRRESLKLHVLKLSQNIEGLRLKLAEDREIIDVKLKELKTEEQELQQAFSIQSENKIEADLNTCALNSRDTLSTMEIENVPNLNSENGRCMEDKENTGAQISVSSAEELKIHCSMQSENKDGVTFDASEPLHWDKLSRKRIDSVANLEADNVNCGTASSDPAFRDQTSSSFIGGIEKRLDFDMKHVVSHVSSLKTEVKQCFVENKFQAVTSRTSPLSNKERFILRKEALAMKKPPVLAIGRSDMVTGAAKVLKAHFKKHPLAIVDVKGITNRTLVREMASELEQATGAFLVCHETNQVILYRGWGVI